MFFSFQLALPKTSVLLLCQHNSRFLTFFILFFTPLPFFPLFLRHFALCPLEFRPLFSYSRLYHSLSFRGSLRFFAISVCFNSRFLTFFILFFALCLFPFAFGTFRPLPFSILQTAFCPLLPPFVVFFLFCVWNSPFALLLTAICCKNLLLDKKFSKNKKV